MPEIIQIQVNVGCQAPFLYLHVLRHVSVPVLQPIGSFTLDVV